ncbi:DNA ligase D [Paracoccus sp. (in: a-proteobacteria)]|uniref:DNA ligase D n=1 Tax=Paracoccus sp. TaxID=267 RepID=UPI00396C915D
MAKLDQYRKKRNFGLTPEPDSQISSASGHSFVIQKHAARRLHYDLRLEMEGVLRSWAVTKGPSLVPGEKRLAVHVEDHPLDYADFEGTIPKGQYGGGTVIVWDRGQWVPVADPEHGFAKGHLEFELQGEKLSGRWHLVKMQGKSREARENWLLIKGEDAAARDEGALDILEERPESVKTGRTVEEVAAEGPASGRRPAEKTSGETEGVNPSAITGARKAPLPDFVAPALATLKRAPPTGNNWLHEIKFDGYRLQARIDGQDIRLLTRGGLDWSDRFGPELVDGLSRLPVKTALIDAEVVVEAGGGASSFSALQADLSAGRTDRFVLYLLDLLYLDGQDLRKAPLCQRKDALEKLVPAEQGRIRFSSHFKESGGLVLRHACRLSLEGLVSKKADAPYRSGRGTTWIKSKCSERQEFVIAGYVPSSTSNRAVGSLVLGVHHEGHLEHVGRVGTGFTTSVAESLYETLDRLRTKTRPFRDPLTADQKRQVLYVRPELVAEVEFRAWTADGQLRHASFRGLREDKPAAEIVREANWQKDQKATAPRRKVALTHADRVYWPDVGVTKEGLADYHADIWPHIAPHIVGRPLALLRVPNGIGGKSFFQKHAWKGISKHVRMLSDPKDKAGEPLIAIDDLDGLLALIQSAVLEIHPWGVMGPDLERPDIITMDLDPGEGVSWEAVIDAALEVRQRLSDAGLEAYVKTSGGKGLHIVSPLKPEAEWPAVKAFTKSIATRMAADDPSRYVATVTKSKRRGKILIDYLRNQRGMTAVAAFSPRARPGAPVSMPLAWDELSPAIGPDYFNLLNAHTRVQALTSDPWEGFRKAEKSLPLVS